MFNLKFKLMLMTALIIFTSCMKQDQEPPMPEIDIPIQEMNTKIQIYDLSGDNTFQKNNEGIDFNVKNLSDTPIVFEKDFNTVIFTKENGRWIVVENYLGYANVKHLLKPSNVDRVPLSSGVIPFIPNLQAPTIIRIVIVGHEKDDPSAKPVGAFIDVTLNP